MQRGKKDLRHSADLMQKNGDKGQLIKRLNSIREIVHDAKLFVDRFLDSQVHRFDGSNNFSSVAKCAIFPLNLAIFYLVGAKLCGRRIFWLLSQYFEGKLGGFLCKI